ncbi:hypothetical protein GYMLUDRAFT_180369 [Collybiopsis luxurians FD-317 M1]|uniref:Unplaced genomic scaffold GYMLUscaffold_98, whole genome shotgun sequence n=1 Tax=Collybiopsis luxurians FD-317 M1 TaxID=944289 RepID=A0A0D0C322_9AGAR|nr:hypothetical protein GYMLUDRAFT_180369 [Collybiopsis luxurians FD-317 M1]
MPTELKHKKFEAAGPSRSFLLEERITLQDGEQFKKYIHNSSPLLNLLEEESEYHICLFLCACQHFQYIKTHHMAYVSDFQGYGGLLTDVQIMTSPPSTPKERLFGHGNINEYFNKFPFEHQCNDFCLWLGLEHF